MSGPNSKRTDVNLILPLCRGIAKPDFEGLPWLLLRLRPAFLGG
jgi:hypothetical protein